MTTPMPPNAAQLPYDGDEMPITTQVEKHLTTVTTGVFRGFIPAIVASLVLVTVATAVVNVNALSNYLHTPDTPWGVAWIGPIAVQTLIVTGEMLTVSNAILRDWKTLTAGALGTVAGLSLEITAHAHFTHNPDTQIAMITVTLVCSGSWALVAFFIHRGVEVVDYKETAADRSYRTTRLGRETKRKVALAAHPAQQGPAVTPAQAMPALASVAMPLPQTAGATALAPTAVPAQAAPRPTQVTVQLPVATVAQLTEAQEKQQEIANLWYQVKAADPQLSQADFCRDHGVNGPYLSRALKRFPQQQP